MRHGFSPTIRRRRLARILRDFREESGHTLDSASKGSGVPRSTIGRLESTDGKRIQTTHLDALAKLYGLDEESWRSLHQLAKDAGERGWWSKYKDVFSDSGLPSFEVEASCIRTYQAQVIPGLLQTAAYTRAVFTGTNTFQEEQIARHVDGRMKRQEILERLYPPEYVAIIDEAALRRFAGDPEVMREQLDHLTAMAKRPRVSIHVLPFSAGMHAANLGSFQILEFPEATDPTIAYTETATSRIFSEEDEEIRCYETMWREAHNAALTAAQSVSFIKDMITSLESTT